MHPLRLRSGLRLFSVEMTYDLFYRALSNTSQTADLLKSYAIIRICRDLTSKYCHYFLAVGAGLGNPTLSFDYALL